MRHGDRKANELRSIQVQRHFTQSAPGSVLIQAGRTRVLCTACIEESVPPWKADQEQPTGWVTAEYSMLPGSTIPRKRRERGKLDGRSSEIQRLIGRSLRGVLDLQALAAQCQQLCLDQARALCRRTFHLPAELMPSSSSAGLQATCATTSGPFFIYR